MNYSLTYKVTWEGSQKGIANVFISCKIWTVLFPWFMKSNAFALKAGIILWEFCTVEYYSSWKVFWALFSHVCLTYQWNCRWLLEAQLIVWNYQKKMKTQSNGTLILHSTEVHISMSLNVYCNIQKISSFQVSFSCSEIAEDAFLFLGTLGWGYLHCISKPMHTFSLLMHHPLFLL